MIHRVIAKVKAKKGGTPTAPPEGAPLANDGGEERVAVIDRQLARMQKQLALIDTRLAILEEGREYRHAGRTGHHVNLNG